MKWIKEYDDRPNRSEGVNTILLKLDNNKSDNDTFDELSDYLQELFDMFRIKEMTNLYILNYNHTDIRWLKVDDSIKIYTNNEEEEKEIISELRKRRVNIENRLGHKLYIVPMSNYGIYGIRIQILR